ncbi:hypothetical protein DNTS_005326 [Danionella cerebrum]|uniref:Protein kinase domain-containing protein n=1 Tax=Danionella cerebrum TaxID=2873325 RepID=A0A553R759_9TELE|nr:hypothetical protein DNTS_005326 [Danionella translucida]
MHDFVITYMGTFSEDLACVILQVVTAAQVCCERGVFHRDIKMENILINPQTLQVKLIDFGCGEILTTVGYTTFAGTGIKEYKRLQQPADATQPSITGFIRPGQAQQAVQLYDANSPRQQEIHNAIIKDLLIGCTLPLSIVENEHFRHFLKVMDNKYTPIARKTITEKHIPLLVEHVKDSIKRKFETQSSVSITADIWSDRTMRSFFGVTAHGINQTENQLESFLLDCRRFCGRHSGDNIAMAFDEIIDEYNIASKVSYIITDNAANMKCAFKVKLPQEEQHTDGSDAEDGNLDDESLWEDVSWEEETVLFGLNWVDLDVTNHEDPVSVKKLGDDLKRSLIDTLTTEVEAAADGDILNSGVNSDADAATNSPPGKCPRLLARYRAHKHLSHTAKDTCISSQIHKYFDAIQRQTQILVLSFGLQTERDSQSSTLWQ